MEHSYPVKEAPCIYDEKVGAAYAGARFLPQTILNDRSGRIVDGFLGLREKEQLTGEIALALK